MNTNTSSTANTIAITEVSAVEQRRRIDEAIARRAYEIFQTRGGAGWHELDDWRQAESEVRCELCFGLTTSVDSVLVACDTGRFEKASMELWVSPRQITICGKPRRLMPLGAGPVPTYSGKVFRVVVLPAAVAPNKGFARWRSSFLEIDLPIVRPEVRQLARAV